MLKSRIEKVAVKLSADIAMSFLSRYTWHNLTAKVGACSACLTLIDASSRFFVRIVRLAPPLPLWLFQQQKKLFHTLRKLTPIKYHDAGIFHPPQSKQTMVWPDDAMPSQAKCRVDIA